MKNPVAFEVYWNASRGPEERMQESMDEFICKRFAAESAFAAGEDAALAALEVICMKCYKDRPASQVRCSCGGLYVIAKEQVDGRV